MENISFEKYKLYYDENNLLYGGSLSGYHNKNKVLNNKQLLTKYNKYKSRLAIKNEKIQTIMEDRYNKMVSDVKNKIWEKEEEKNRDEEWVSLLGDIRIRDQYECQLLKCLEDHEKKTLHQKAPEHLLRILDGAHIIRRSACLFLYYEQKNVSLINRYSHSALDLYCDPITYHPIDAKQVVDWWIRIIGKERYIWLLNRKDSYDRGELE